LVVGFAFDMTYDDHEHEHEHGASAFFAIMSIELQIPTRHF
jgi:hypothetical protein